MNKKIVRSFLVISLVVQQVAWAAPSHVLTFFVEPYPTLNASVKGHQNNGIFFTYFGSQTTADSNNEVRFTLKTVEPKFYMLVSTSTKPVFMLFNTIDHWELKENATYAFFSIERHYDEKIKQHFWSVEQTELPNNLEIPLNTIVVEAEPEHIYVPTGITLTTDSAQLLLPPIFVKPTKKLSYNAIKFVEHGEFFARVGPIFKVEKDGTESKVSQGD